MKDCKALFLLIAVVATVAGCQSDQSTEDDSRSYFDGGALESPEPMTIVLTGRVLKSQGRVVEAEYVLRRATTEFPSFSPAYTELAELLLKDGRTGEAIELLEIGISEVPNDAVMRNDLGIALIVQGNQQRAAEMFSVAKRLDPSDATYTANLAMTMGLMGNYDAAVALYSEVVPVVEAHENVASLAEARGDTDRAARERAIVQKASP